MTSAVFLCPFEDCKFSKKPEQAEFSFFRKHLTRDHDYSDIEKFAFKIGIIQDIVRYHNPNFVLRKLTELSKIKNG